MRKTPIILFVLLLSAAPALAQERTGSEKRVFFYGAPGVIIGTEIATLHFGGGTETVWPNGIGFAFDAGYITPLEAFEEGFFTVSPALLYEFQIDGKLKPYVRGGVTLMFNHHGGDLPLHVGGGVNYWFKERMAMKCEVRDTFYAQDAGTGLLDFIVGVVFKY